MEEIPCAIFFVSMEDKQNLKFSAKSLVSSSKSTEGNNFWFVL